MIFKNWVGKKEPGIKVKNKMEAETKDRRSSDLRDFEEFDNFLKAGDLEMAYKMASGMDNQLWKIAAMATVSRGFIDSDIERSWEIANKFYDFYFGCSLWRDIAKALAKAGRFDRAYQAVRKIPRGGDFDREEALVNIIQSLVNARQLEKARQLLPEVNIFPAFRIRAFLAVGDFEKSRQIAAEARDGPIALGQYLVTIAEVTKKVEDINNAIKISNTHLSDDEKSDTFWRNFIRQRVANIALDKSP